MPSGNMAIAKAGALCANRIDPEGGDIHSIGHFHRAGVDDAQGVQAEQFTQQFIFVPGKLGSTLPSHEIGGGGEGVDQTAF